MHKKRSPHPAPQLESLRQNPIWAGGGSVDDSRQSPYDHRREERESQGRSVWHKLLSKQTPESEYFRPGGDRGGVGLTQTSQKRRRDSWHQSTALHFTRLLKVDLIDKAWDISTVQAISP
jgi:hypothetical protein